MLKFWGEKEFWNARYLEYAEPYDWYLSSGDTRAVLDPFLNKNFDIKILNIGCGTSELPFHLFHDGFKMSMNIDNSKVAIDQMLLRLGGASYPKFQEMDCLEIKFSTASFDLVIDKGTMDSIMCGRNPGDKFPRMMAEIHRVLKPSGIFICISHAPPDNRLTELTSDPPLWDIDFYCIRKKTIEEKLAPITKDGPAVSADVQERMLKRSQMPPKGEELNFHYMYVCRRKSK